MHSLADGEMSRSRINNAGVCGPATNQTQEVIIVGYNDAFLSKSECQMIFVRGAY
ncbi:MAG: hypothetical protein ABSG67_13145 [Thermoguttaceae bacterium]